MSALDLFTFTSEIVFRFAPLLTDSGIQIWNSIEVDEIAKEEGFTYPTPLCCQEEVEEPTFTRRKREINQRIYEAHTGFKFFNFVISLEGLISLGLVQLPGICLGLYGIQQAFAKNGLSMKAVKDSLRSCLLFFLPFFVVEFLEFLKFFFSGGINACCSFLFSKLTESTAEKFDILFFIGNEDKTGKAKIIALDAAKVFFGSVIQINVQVYFIEVSGQEPKFSQILSVVSSLLLICKTGYEVISYTNPGTAEKDTSKQTTVEKIKGKIRDFLKLIPGVLSELPLLGSTLIFKLGTINLCILFFGWYGIFVLVTFFLLNVLSCYIARLDRVSKLFAGERIVMQELEETAKKPGMKHILYTSYANIFMFTRPVESKSDLNLRIPVILQPLQFLLSLIFIIVFKNWGFFTDTAKYPTVLHEVASGSFATIIIIVGFASLFFAFIDWKCKIGREETPLKELEKEFLEFLKFYKNSKENEKKLKEEGPTEMNETAESPEWKENVENIA